MSVDDNTLLKCPFRRLTVLLPPSMVESGKKLRALSGERKRGSGFSESAEIIAEVLSLVLIDRTNLEDSKYEQILQQNLEENPLLLYYTTIELLETVDELFARIIAKYWEEKLYSSGTNFADLSRQEQEARHIIFSLITSHRSAASHNGRHQQRVVHPGTETPRKMQLSQDKSNVPSTKKGGKRVALATNEHLSQLPSLISTKTHFAQEEIFVEESNFESTYKRLKQASPTSLTFIFVYITGRISADQMKRIVEVPVPAIKLIFQYSSSIVDLLELTPSIDESIYKPASICEALVGKLRPVSYSKKSAVGCVLEHTMRRLRAQPDLISQPGMFWDAAGPERTVADGSKWLPNIKEWLGAGSVDAESAFVRILLTSDDMATARSLEIFLSTNMEAPVNVRVVDAGDRLKFDGLRDFVESKTTTASLSYSTFKPPADSDAKSKPTPTREIVVLSRASFLGHDRLMVLVSRCAQRGTKLILLVSEATSSISRFRVFKVDRAPPIWIRVPTLTQKLLGGIGAVGLRWEELPQPSFASDPNLLAFVGLQLLLSPESVVTEDHRTSVYQFVESQPREDSHLDFMANFDCLDGKSAMRGDIVLALANVTNMTNVASDQTALPQCLAVVLAVHVNRYLRFREGSCDDASCPLHLAISFSDFCRQPKVRFLSQIHRIEAYMFFLFHKTIEDKRFVSNVHSDMPFGWPIGASFAELSNIHHASSPGPIMMCTLSTTANASNMTIPIDLPVPQYVDPGKGDVVTQMQEIVEHRALAGSELHWQDMYQRWQSGAELTDDVLDHILVNSPCRISVLLSMKPSHISNLSLSKDAIDAVSLDFEGCEDLLRFLPQKECSEFQDLRTRTAAIWWLLLTADKIKVDDKVFGEEQSLLLDHGIMIQPKGEQGTDVLSKQGADLLSRLARVMISSDTENTLTSQHAVREYLLSDTEAITEILKDPTVILGNSFMNAITSTATLKAIMEGKSGTIIYNRLCSALGQGCKRCRCRRNETADGGLCEAHYARSSRDASEVCQSPSGS